MELLLVTVAVIYLFGGFVFFATFGWCLGMPASSCRTRKDKIKKFCAEWSMVLFYPFWIIFMVCVIIKGS